MYYFPVDKDLVKIILDYAAEIIKKNPDISKQEMKQILTLENMIISYCRRNNIDIKALDNGEYNRPESG